MRHKSCYLIFLVRNVSYEQKKISNIVYKLKKQEKIKAVKKGVYVKV